MCIESVYVVGGCNVVARKGMFLAVVQGSILTCASFHLENFLVTYKRYKPWLFARTQPPLTLGVLYTCHT